MRYIAFFIYEFEEFENGFDEESEALLLSSLLLSPSLLLLEFAEVEGEAGSGLPNNDDCVAPGCGGTAAGFGAGLRAAFLLGAAFLGDAAFLGAALLTDFFAAFFAVFFAAFLGTFFATFFGDFFAAFFAVFFADFFPAFFAVFFAVFFAAFFAFFAIAYFCFKV